MVLLTRDVTSNDDDKHRNMSGMIVEVLPQASAVLPQASAVRELELGETAGNRMNVDSSN